MLVLTIVTVLQFCKLRYKMLVRPINVSLWYYVKDNVVLQALYLQVIVCTRNLNPRCYGLWKANLDTNYPDQNGQTPTQAPLAFYCRIDLIPWCFFQIDLFSISPWLTMLLRFDVHLLYTPIYRFSPSYFRNSLSTVSIERVNGIPLWVFYPSDFQRALKTRGAHVKILTGMLVLFFWVWNLARSYFSGLANFLAIFLGFAKISAIFWVWQISSYFLSLPIFVSHTWILWMKNTQSWKT